MIQTSSDFLLAIMLRREVSIDSYFSMPTDLAVTMGSWPEFVSGSGYSVSLASEHEKVETSLEVDEGHPLVYVRGTGDGDLYFRVLGATLYALAQHSDDVWPRVMRWDKSNG
jgi:hypothetical protein